MSAINHAEAVTLLDSPEAVQNLSPGARENIRRWLTEPRYAEYAPLVAEHLRDKKWKTLDDVFWTVIPFGTGGRRGVMYPIGTNAINDRTIGESAQGLADYLLRNPPPGVEPACAIAYDTRHRSRHFAELCAEIMAGNGVTVYFLEGHRSTPALSVAVRHMRCACGIMVTASHNPPSDNAVKVYWAGGVQVLPPHDAGIIQCVAQVQDIRRLPWQQALDDGKIRFCQDQVDAAYVQGVLGQSTPGPRELKIVYSPMHGVGATSVVPALRAAGFDDLEVFGPHAQPDGDFPNVPDHVANPENPRTFDAIIHRAEEIGADVVLSSDPDADRLGAAAPRFAGGPWATFTGNQIGALLAEYVLSQRRAAGVLGREHYLAKTLVTTEMIRRIGDQFGVRTCGDLLVGFKWIGGLIDQQGPERFVLGVEESHGYLAGTYARDKDAAVAALLLCELAARLKAQGQTLHEKLDALFWQYGAHAERTISQSMPGSEGMARMQRLMARFRQQPPDELADLPVRQVRDYQAGTIVAGGAQVGTLDTQRGDLVILDLEAEGNYAAVRPSGTEPKVKFYLFAYEPPELLADLDDAKRLIEQRLDRMEADLRRLAQETA